MAYILAENPFAKLCNLRFESIVISDVGKTKAHHIYTLIGGKKMEVYKMVGVALYHPSMGVTVKLLTPCGIRENREKVLDSALMIVYFKELLRKSEQF